MEFDMQIEEYDKVTGYLQNSISKLMSEIGAIKIGNTEIFPYGWSKAAKGRTVWRLVEEVVVQNLEKNPERFGLESINPASSEVGVFDLELRYSDIPNPVYINIKSAVKGGRTNKDDISKAVGLIDFLSDHPDDLIFIVTIELDFSPEMEVILSNSYVMPTGWLPDLYVNPSNNGNLQSSKYKDISIAIKRDNAEFLRDLSQAKEIADEKRRKKRLG